LLGALEQRSSERPSLQQHSPSAAEDAGATEPSDGFKRFAARMMFTEDCEMESVRAYQVVHHLKDLVADVRHIPEDLFDEPAASETIRNEGFQLFLTTDKSYDEMYSALSQTSYLKELVLKAVQNGDARDGQDAQDAQNAQERRNVQDGRDSPPKPAEPLPEKAAGRTNKETPLPAGGHQGKFINVNVAKLDELMDLVGELVIAEAMVTQNPDIAGLQLEQFQKAASHLQKITREIQDKVMEIRMVPLAAVFQRMHRIVRDMGKKLGKNVQLQLAGEETEVDKNIIDHISDPLMHLVRNAVDHGLETARERAEAGKPETGTLTLEALNNGGEVLITVRDDGRGLDKRRILEKAKARQLLHRPEADMTDKEIFQLIFLPGFSTKEEITEFSGRGVGMDVVVQNIAAVGGTIAVDSRPGEGTVFTIKIPLTLAIIDAMNVRVGEAQYTLPTTSIKESFKPLASDVITAPDGREMIMVRGECYPILRIHELFRVSAEHTQIHDGILIMAEHEGRGICILVDELVGQQQVVVKALPPYLRRLNHVDGISGCTLLGDGNISLILDVQGLLKMTQEGVNDHVGRIGRNFMGGRRFPEG
jgi:two-component system chemotaxis sensor kinase CheA